MTNQRKHLKMKPFIKLIFILIVFLTSCSKEDELPELNFTDESNGCSDFMVYKINESNEVAVAVTGQRTNLALDSTVKSFDLSTLDANDLKVQVKRYKDFAGMCYCNDMIDEEIELISTWTSVSGNVSIQIVEDNTTLGYGYVVDVLIDNVVLENENGKSFTLDHLNFLNVSVGWYPG